MATQSLAENLSEREPSDKSSHISDDIPGLGDLLISVDRNASLEQLDHYQNAASNVLSDILPGVSALGDLVWHTSLEELEDYPIGRKTLRAIGVLIQHLTQYIQSMQELEANTGYWRLQHLKEQCGMRNSL